VVGGILAALLLFITIHPRLLAFAVVLGDVGHTHCCCSCGCWQVWSTVVPVATSATCLDGVGAVDAIHNVAPRFVVVGGILAALFLLITIHPYLLALAVVLGDVGDTHRRSCDRRI